MRLAAILLFAGLLALAAASVVEARVVHRCDVPAGISNRGHQAGFYRLKAAAPSRVKLSCGQARATLRLVHPAWADAGFEAMLRRSVILPNGFACRMRSAPGMEIWIVSCWRRSAHVWAYYSAMG